MKNRQLTNEQQQDVLAATRTIRSYLQDKSVEPEEFMDACFRMSLALIFLGIRPLNSAIRPKYKGRQMRENWGWDICFALPWAEGAATHVFNWKTHTTIWPGRFTLEEAIQFTKDMEEGGFLKQLNKRQPKR